MNGTDTRGKTRTQTAPPCLTAARRYLQLGWSVVAVCPPDHRGESRRHTEKLCNNPGKCPVVPWKVRQVKLVAEDELTSWFSGCHSSRNVGMICGDISGLVGIDVDGDAGETTLQEMSGGDLPESLEFLTPNGGRRLLYQIPPGVRIRTTHRNDGSTEHTGISFLGEGGHTVMPPSRHKNGGIYRWVEGKGPDDIEPAVAPAWLIEELRADQPPTQRAKRKPAANGQVNGPDDSPSAQEELPPADADAVLSGCAFLQHCRNDAATLPENHWYMMITNIVRTDSGAELVHKLSRDYPRYTAGETDEKIRHALADTGPHSCQHIEQQTGGEWCLECPHKGRITSPVVLGHRRRDGDKPVIVVGPDESRVVDDAIAALGNVDGIYQRGGLLVHIVSGTKPPKGIDRAGDTRRIIQLPRARLRELMSSSAAWEQIKKVGTDWASVATHPPEWAVKAVEARGQWDSIPPIVGVVETPVLLSDGSILNAPGFNRDHGLFYAPSIPFPEVLTEPNREDVAWAVDTLTEAVCDFPFKSESHQSAWLAAVLTPFARQAYAGPTPLILVDANTRGAGKGLLLDIIAKIFTGAEMARTSNPKTEEESAKLITSVAIAAEPMLMFDNVDGKLGTPSLDAALTAKTWSGRILGRNETTGRLPLRTIWFATGNNIVLRGDTSRRTLHIRLDYLGESPEERSGFKHENLLEWVGRERATLAAAVLTILRGYWLAGRPNMDLKAWGSFEGWSRLIRSAVVWAGLRDPAFTRQELAEQADGEAALLQQLLDGWAELDPGSNGITVADAYALLKKHPEGYPKLRAALMNLPGAKGENLPSRRSVGMQLHHWQRRVIGGEYFDRKPAHRGGAIWRVEVTRNVHD